MAKSFIFRRFQNPSLFITPFSDVKQSGLWSDTETITWYASTGLTSQEKDDALFTLYQQYDKGVDYWIQERRYIPRLLITAFIFLILYVFFSLVVRDPIPMVDELIIATVGSLVSWRYLASKDRKSEIAERRRLVLKQNASRGTFVIDENLSVYEDYIDRCSALDPMTLANKIARFDGESLEPLHTKKIDESTHLLIQKLFIQHVKSQQHSLYEMYLQVKKVHQSGKNHELLAARLLKASHTKKIDIPLLAFLVELTK
ncbi:MAG: hypothetical protein ACOX0W_01020 [Sphaerochaetaceae bacterium]|jgi:hypothetical protein